MNILCYGKSELRQKARCEFFIGAGCAADWTTELPTALQMLTVGRYDAVILGPTVTPSESERIDSRIKQLNRRVSVFTLATCLADPVNSPEEPDLSQQLPAILYQLNILRPDRIAR